MCARVKTTQVCIAQAQRRRAHVRQRQLQQPAVWPVPAAVCQALPSRRLALLGLGLGCLVFALLIHLRNLLAHLCLFPEEMEEGRPWSGPACPVGGRRACAPRSRRAPPPPPAPAPLFPVLGRFRLVLLAKLALLLRKLPLGALLQRKDEGERGGTCKWRAVARRAVQGGGVLK